MTDRAMVLLSDKGNEIVEELMEIVPSWKKVSSTRRGYEVQYFDTLLKLAVYIMEREQKLLKEVK